MKTKNIFKNAYNILNGAIEVFEEEIAAGVCAAKEFESKFENLENTKDQNFLINRIRQDIHDLIDLTFDSSLITIKKISALTEMLIEYPTSRKSKETPIVHSEKVYQPGETAYISLEIEQSNHQNILNSIQKQDLTTPSGDSINRRNIKLVTGKITKNSESKKVQELNMEIYIPKKTKSGRYISLFSIDKDEMNQFKIIVDVS